MSDSRRLEVSDRVPRRGELHQLFRHQEVRCGNVEEWSLPHLSAIAGQGTGRFVRADGTLVGAGLRDGSELLLAVAFGNGSDRPRITAALLQSSAGAAECWIPTHDRDLAENLAGHGWRPFVVDLQMRLALPTEARRRLPHGFNRVELAGPDDVVLHRAVHHLACQAWCIDGHLEAFLDRHVRHPAYDAGLWVLAEDGTGICGVAIGQVLQMPDATVGKVTALAVAPRARGSGVAAALLDQLCGRFASRGLLLAQLGVHEDNRSGAASLYRHLSWIQVSSRTRWTRGATSGGYLSGEHG